MSERTFLPSWAPALAWMMVIFAASTDLGSAEHTSRILLPLLDWLKPGISAQSVATIQFCVRKSAHVTEYAVLAMLLLRAFRARSRGTFAIQAALVLLVAVGYAATDEFHQSFNPSRTPSARDVLIDSCGALFGLGVYTLLRRELPATAVERKTAG